MQRSGEHVDSKMPTARIYASVVSAQWRCSSLAPAIEIFIVCVFDCFNFGGMVLNTFGSHCHIFTCQRAHGNRSIKKFDSKMKSD